MTVQEVTVGHVGPASANARPQAPQLAANSAEEGSADALPRTAQDERADVLAYLRRRHANAGLIEAGTKGSNFGPEIAQLAADRRPQLEVIIGEIEGALHVGEVALQEELNHG